MKEINLLIRKLEKKISNPKKGLLRKSKSLLELVLINVDLLIKKKKRTDFG